MSGTSAPDEPASADAARHDAGGAVMPEHPASPLVPWPFADLALAQRLEHAEGCASRAFVEARAALQPESGAEWAEVAGALAMFDGVASPLTQTFGLGLHEPATPAALAGLEAFFAGRGADVFHEVSPLAGHALFGLLAGRGYRPVELTTVLYRPLPGPDAGDAPSAARRRAGDLQVRLIEPDEADRWAAVAAAGWDELPEIAEFLHEYGRINARSRGVRAFLAEHEGEPIAAAALSIQNGVALFAGASTIPAGRRRGAQLALLDARLRDAAALGCDLALIGAAPGSGSQRNAERNGFRVAYTRVKWRLPAAAAGRAGRSDRGSGGRDAAADRPTRAPGHDGTGSQ